MLTWCLGIRFCWLVPDELLGLGWTMVPDWASLNYFLIDVFPFSILRIYFIICLLNSTWLWSSFSKVRTRPSNTPFSYTSTCSRSVLCFRNSMTPSIDIGYKNWLNSRNYWSYYDGSLSRLSCYYTFNYGLWLGYLCWLKFGFCVILGVETESS